MWAIYYRDGHDLIRKYFNTIDEALSFLRAEFINTEIYDEIQSYYDGIYTEHDLHWRLMDYHVAVYPTTRENALQQLN